MKFTLPSKLRGDQEVVTFDFSTERVSYFVPKNHTVIVDDIIDDTGKERIVRFYNWKTKEVVPTQQHRLTDTEHVFEILVHWQNLFSDNGFKPPSSGKELVSLLSELTIV
jgi:hypothetical protein